MPKPGFGKQRGWRRQEPGQGRLQSFPRAVLQSLTAAAGAGRCETVGTCPSRILGVKQEPDTHAGGPEWTARRHKDRASRRRAGDAAGMRLLWGDPGYFGKASRQSAVGSTPSFPTAVKAVAWAAKIRPPLP